MKQRWYKVELLAPLSFTARNVTQGDYACLDYIPGQSLLGATARRYADFNNADAWQVFHSGQVRFGDAFLLTKDEQPALPMPFSLHEIKRQQAATLSNQAFGQVGKNLQYEQLRSGHLQLEPKTLEAQKHDVTTSSSIKIAVDPTTGSARDGYLYGMEAINAGQSYVCSISADETISNALFDQIETAFIGHQRLGRSKNAEFGLVKISPLVDFETCWKPVGQSAEITNEAVIYLTGHLALDDQHGQQRLLPEAADFGLPATWQLELSRSFMRYFVFDRFNGHRAGFDIQREVVERGSVLVFKNNQPLNEHELANAKRTAAHGAGLNRQEGLGQYLLNPAWLLQPAIKLATIEQTTPSAAVALPDVALGAFLESRLPQLNQIQHERLYALAEKLARMCTQPFDTDKWPSESQWSRARQWAKSAALTKASFLQLVGGTQGKMSRGWENTYQKEQTLGEFFSVEAASHLKSDAEKREFLSELAHLVRGNLVHRQKAVQNNQEVVR